MCTSLIASGYGNTTINRTLPAYYQLLLIAEVSPDRGTIAPRVWLDGTIVGSSVQQATGTTVVEVYTLAGWPYAGDYDIEIRSWPLGQLLRWSLYGCIYGPPQATPTPTPYVYPTSWALQPVTQCAAWVEPQPVIVANGQVHTLSRQVPGYGVYSIEYDSGVSYAPARYEIVSWQTSLVVTYTTPISLTVYSGERYDIRVLDTIGVGTGVVIIRYLENCPSVGVPGGGGPISPIPIGATPEQVEYGVVPVGRDCYTFIPAFTVTVPWDQGSVVFDSPGLRLCVNWLSYRLSLPIIAMPLDAAVPALLILGLAFRVYRLVVR